MEERNREEKGLRMLYDDVDEVKKVWQSKGMALKVNVHILYVLFSREGTPVKVREIRIFFKVDRNIQIQNSSSIVHVNILCESQYLDTNKCWIVKNSLTAFDYIFILTKNS